MEFILNPTKLDLLKMDSDLVDLQISFKTTLIIHNLIN